MVKMNFSFDVINDGEEFDSPFSDSIYAGFVGKMDRMRRRIGDIGYVVV